VIYYITSLELPKEVINKIIIVIQAYPKGRVGVCDKVTGGKCKVKLSPYFTDDGTYSAFGRNNCGDCHVCNQVQDAHHLFKYRFTTHIWTFMLALCGIQDIHPDQWAIEAMVEDFWARSTPLNGENRMSLVTLTMLISWEV
jgi:hypothetical protein